MTTLAEPNTDTTPDVEELFSSILKDDWMPKTGLGGLIAGAAIISILYNFICLPLFAALWALTIGYCLRCIRVKTADPRAKLPDWSEWGDLFMSGITWLALQTGVWSFTVIINLVLITFCSAYAMNDKSSNLSLVWIIGSTIFVLVFSAFTTLFSSYLMINFAIEENVKAGLDLQKIAERISRSPKRLLSGFMLAFGIQWLMTVLPIMTIIGVIFAPQLYFASQLLSSLILAQHWNADVQAKSRFSSKPD